MKKAVGILIAAAAIVGIAFGIGPTRRVYRDATLRRDLSRLVDASTQVRTYSRLSVAAPVGRATVRSGIAESKPILVYAAVAAVLDRAQYVDAVSSLRASAIAHYYAGQLTQSVDELEQLVEQSPSAAAWNDLAAARLEASAAAGQVIEIVPAMVAVEQALAVDPTFPPALYNRAALLERMGLRHHALAAWRHAFVAENDPEWRDDIRKHIAQIPSEVDEALASKVFATLSPDALDDVRRAVEQLPQDARRYAESVFPVEWATAAQNRDTITAERKLRVARAVATALRDRSGETLAAEAIDTIDAATKSGDAARIALIVSAYSAYGQARALLRAQKLAAAEAGLTQAGDLFARAKNPMANVARYNVATAILEQNRVEEAAARYAALVRTERASPGHRGLAAQLAWHVARTEGIRGRWDAALEATQTAVEGFRALGERQNTGFMENMLAELHDYLGQPERAWAHRLVAFDLLSAAGNARQLQVSLGAAARERIRREDWPGAIALLHLEIAESRRADQTSLLVDALARISRAKASDGDGRGALQDIGIARAAAARVNDAQERARAVAAIDFSEGIALRAVDPKSSIRLLTNAIDFYRTARPILLPELHLERGRSHLALGADVQALADFDSGIGQLEEQRARLSDFDFHSTVGDVGEDLFTEAIRVAVRRRDVEGAYRLSERSRGRTLLSRLTTVDVSPPTRAETGTRVVELMALPERLIVFTIDHELRMQELDVGRPQLQRLVDSYTAKMINDVPAEELRIAGAELYDVLLRPLGAVTAGVSTLVFVSSGILERVPWAALYDREQKRYVAEDVIVMSAPSATLFALTAVGGGSSHARRALIVGNPKITSTFVDLPVLRGAEAEAHTIAEYYPAHTLLLGADATRGRIHREAATCEVLHFAGHAVSSETSDNQSFLVLAPAEGDSGVFYARDIAKLDLRNTSLVVLAACGTIRGSTVHIDGMPSIGRAFIAAGAATVIGTLWDIDDRRSAALFERIHRDVSSGTPVAQAVRDAQLHAIRSSDPATAHPKTWGCLTVMGRRSSRATDSTVNR